MKHAAIYLCDYRELVDSCVWKVTGYWQLVKVTDIEHFHLTKHFTVCRTASLW